MKPIQSIPVARLHHIPAFDETLGSIVINCVGPLPKTKSGNIYLVTLMYALRLGCQTPFHLEMLLFSKLFMVCGLQKGIQSNQGFSFKSELFHEARDHLDRSQFVASAYHLKSHGAFECCL